jgi:hypothetical protein
VTLVGVLLLVSCSLQSCAQEPASPWLPIPGPESLTQQPPTKGTLPTLGHRRKTSGCVSSNSLPDAACTPGAIFADATVDKICTPGYSSQVRNVPSSVKDEVYAEYGITSHEPGQYEVDHLVSLQLGGSNDIANLWPEPADPPPGFHEKDKVENYLHDQICSGSLPLRQAQYEISTDWLSVYKRIP